MSNRVDDGAPRANASQNGQDEAGSASAPRRKSRFRSLGQGRKPLYAAVDLGTNNCRLLIVQSAHGGFRVRDSFSRIVRLGEGLDATGSLSEAAIVRTIGALRICASKIRRAGVTRIRCIATEACREADNGADFIARVRRETGLSLEIIDGDEEAELAAMGCASLFDEQARHIFVFDIGGGSTEIIRLAREAGGRFVPADRASLPLGVVRLAERHAGQGENGHGYEQMMDDAQGHLAEFMARQHAVEDIGDVQLIGTSGTITTLAAVHLGLQRYDRKKVDGITIEAGQTHEIIARLRAKTRDQLAANPCIGHERADLVLAGCAVVDVIHRQWPVERFHVADRGLREGVLLKMIRRDARKRRRRRRRDNMRDNMREKGRGNAPVAMPNG
jgi:exopolyphosphatase/guanosine-5'-triphosphate,3'-diphosphate pyrophosphatase